MESTNKPAKPYMPPARPTYPDGFWLEYERRCVANVDVLRRRGPVSAGDEEQVAVMIYRQLKAEQNYKP